MAGIEEWWNGGVISFNGWWHQATQTWVLTFFFGLIALIAILWWANQNNNSL